MRGYMVCLMMALTGCATTRLSYRVPSSEAQESSAKRTQSDVTICSQYENIFFISINKSVESPCEGFNFLDHAITDMRSLSISNSQPFLGSIVVNKFQGWDWGSHDWFAGTIVFFVKPGDLNWAKANDLIFPHEVGHLFLQAYLTEKDPFFHELLNLQKKSFEYYRYLLPILELKKSNSDCGDSSSVCGRKIADMIATSPIDLNGPSGDKLISDFLVQNKEKVDRFLEVMTAYHELFADLFQALYFDSPNINNFALRGFGIDKQPCRTFDEKLPTGFDSDDQHCSLSSIRTELWQKVVVPSLPNKKKILLKLADAIWAEVAPQLTSSNRIEHSTAAKRLLKRLTEGLPE